MRLHEGQVRALLEATRETHDVEIDCDEFLAHMAACAEARSESRPLPEGHERLLEHERLCANCREEMQALLAILAIREG